MSRKNSMWKPANYEQFIADYNTGCSNDNLASKYNVSMGKIVHYLRYLRNTKGIAPRVAHASHKPAPVDDKSPDSLVIETIVTGDGTKTEKRLLNKDIRSLEELIELYQVDTTKWDVIDFKCATGSWNGFWKDTDNNAQTTTLYRYRCEARFKPKVKKVLDAFADVKLMLEDAKNYAPAYPSIIRSLDVKEHCLEIDIPDLHIGKHAWREETGCANYDVNIAESLFFQALEAAIEFSKNYNIGHILFPIGNDLLNSDSSTNMTTKGTPQDTDGRQKKTFRRTRQMLVTALERLREIAPVTALIIPGNHDQDTCFYIGDTLQGWMQNAKDVTVDNNAYARKTFQWGTNGILFTHGEEKESDLALTFASDYPELWAATKNHEVHCGHLHTTISKDYRSCQVRYFASLTAPDYWHTSKNYRSRRAATSFIWEKDGGSLYQKTWHVPVEKQL